jgi:RNA polymerase sigma-70 factor (ECF subfamily)
MLEMRAAAKAPALDDDRAMAAVARREPAAFRAIALAHGAQLHRIAYRMIGDASEAEDVAQESLLRLWSTAARWRPGGSGIAAWLTRVTVNLCLDRLRRRRFASDEAVPERADPAPGADAALAAERLRIRTLTALATLNARQRAAIVLTYYEELPNAAAAETMDMNLKAFESLLLRARAALKAALAEAGLVTLVGEAE